MGDQGLIRCEIEPDPWHPGPGDVRLRASGVPVWAIISYYYHAARGDAAMVVRDYDIDERAVQAALAYYHRHREAIDNRLAENDRVAVG